VIGVLVNATFVDATLNDLFAHYAGARGRVTEATSMTFGWWPETIIA